MKLLECFGQGQKLHETPVATINSYSATRQPTSMNIEDQGLVPLPKISIGMPVYNRPHALRRTLGEIVKQTYQNLEIIVSDNASPDKDVEKVIKEYMQRDNRIRYYRQPENIGSTNNFQFVKDKATGDFFMWAADDDWRDKNYVEELYKKLTGDSSAVVAFCDFDIRDEDGCPVPYYPDSYTALRLMTESKSTLRQLRFFMLAEGRAIPHVIYGLLSMKCMKDFSWTDHVQRYGEYGADTLYIFWLLGQGRLALVERRLFGCTVNNQKYYDNSHGRSLIKKLLVSTHRIGYLISFIKIAKGWTKLVLVCVLPLKLTETLYSIMIREPIKKVRRAFMVGKYSRSRQ